MKGMQFKSVEPIAQLTDEEFEAIPAHLRGLDRVVDPEAPDFMASRSDIALTTHHWFQCIVFFVAVEEFCCETSCLHVMHVDTLAGARLV